MLTLFGSRPGRSGYCDGVNRRGFLKIGALGVGAFGLNLADIYRAEAASRSHIGHALSLILERLPSRSTTSTW